MNNLLFEVVVILSLVVLNGFLSMSEIAVVSARKIRLQQRARQGVPGARAALELADKPDHFLSTVQIGITLVGVLSGAFAGATIAEELEEFLNTFPWPLIAVYREAISVSLVVVVITFLSLILGELAPKQIGLSDPEAIAARIAPVMRLLSRLVAPIVHALSFTARLVVRLLGVRPSAEPEVTEEEIRLLISQGATGGIFEREEEAMVGHVLRLGDRPVTAHMTPRTEIVWLDLDDSLEAIVETLTAAKFSHYPVGRGNADNIIGILHVEDLLARILAGKPLDLEENLHAPLYLPETMTLLEAFKRFRESREHIALVIDEFGGIQGLSTTTDILEAVAGDSQDPVHTEEPEIIRREDGSYLLDGMLDVDRFYELFNLESPVEESAARYQTLGGLVVTSLGRIPSSGDSFDFQGLHLEVVDMDGLRVDKVLVDPGADDDNMINFRRT